MILRQQSSLTSLLHYLQQKLPGHVGVQQTLPVLGEHRVVETVVHDVQVQEPLEQQVVLQPFAELSLAAHRVKRHQQAGFQQMLREYLGAAVVGVHPVEGGRQLAQGLIHDGLDAPDGMNLGTRASGVTAVSISTCRTALPRMRNLHSPGTRHPTITSLTRPVFQQPANDPEKPHLYNEHPMGYSGDASFSFPYCVLSYSLQNPRRM